MTETVIATVTAVPRPSSSTSSGVSATSGMVWLTRATGIRLRATAGLISPRTASPKATASPAAMPARVIGSVSARAPSNRAWALAAVLAKNR